MAQVTKNLLQLLIVVLFLIENADCAKKLLNIPLDERFTTRIAFLNLAKMTPYQIQTLPAPLLPSLKKYSNPDDILFWTLRQAPSCQFAILSLETLLYGSLIASRISNDSYIDIAVRVDQLVQYKKTRPDLEMFCSGVVMRIPHYNGDFQEPQYWAKYGQYLYTYSYFCDRYNKTKNQSDLSICKNAQQEIPDSVLRSFLWRRARNHNITLFLLKKLTEDRRLFTRLYITLDDSADYGYNAQQALQLKQYIQANNLSSIVSVYPGADQVSLTLLAAAAVHDSNQPNPIISMIFRNETTISNIPNYQGLPMIETLENQIRAAGGLPQNGTILQRGNITLLVNNWQQPKQMQAPSQGPINQKNYSIFDPYLCNPNKTQIIGLADNRYSNGADVFFVAWMLGRLGQGCRNLTQWAYAGWNTNGNTLGTVVANSVLLWVFRGLGGQGQIAQKVVNGPVSPPISPCPDSFLKCSNSYFNTLRILQDKDWQVLLRELTRNFIYQTPGDNINDLSTDLPFYEGFVYKAMAAKQKQLKGILGLEFGLQGVYFPWNRTFQVGLWGSLDKKQQNTVEIE